MYDPDSPIRIRILHQGSPAQINADFFREKLALAKEQRATLLATDTNGFRLVHGENDGLPGLVLDVYAGVAVLKLYSPAWLPWVETLLPLIIEVAAAKVVVLRLARNTGAANHPGKRQQERRDTGDDHPGKRQEERRDTGDDHPGKRQEERRDTGDAGAREWNDGAVLYGSLPDPVVIFREHGIRFAANVVAGHKTGFFLDHRENRRRVGELAEGLDVLDVFSYAGGFSVHALAGGAAAVTSIDISAPALEQARTNAALNDLPSSRHKTLAEDAFAALTNLSRSEREFDLVIVDPPSFAKSEKEVPGALAAYRKINKLAIPLVAPGGILLAASCSARVTAEDFFRTVEGCLMASGRKFSIVDKTYHDVDHPIGFPEGAYLKSGYYRLG